MAGARGRRTAGCAGDGLLPHLRAAAQGVDADAATRSRSCRTTSARSRKAAGRIDKQFPPPPRANVKDFVDHIDYIVKKIGIDHVGISSDFDGGGGVDGWNDASETFNVTLELVRRGYTEDQIGEDLERQPAARDGRGAEGRAEVDSNVAPNFSSAFATPD